MKDYFTYFEHEVELFFRDKIILINVNQLL